MGDDHYVSWLDHSNFFAETLLTRFSGKGLVASDLASNVNYGIAVATGAGLTVLLATRFGIPVSTTHSLVGALIGTGWAAGSVVHLKTLSSMFFAPLPVSPLLASAITSLSYLLFRNATKWCGVTSDTCFCIGNETAEVVPAPCNTTGLQYADKLSAHLGNTGSCQDRYQSKILGITVSTMLNRTHYLSSGLVSFARGLNDTPKIAAMLLLAPAFGGFRSIAWVGFAIALGGIISARRVAETMSHKITAMNHGPGLTANLVTGLTVIGATHFGLPVSTTHVSCGSLFGLGAVTGGAHWKMIFRILAAWFVTLPTAAALGAACYAIVSLF